MWVIHSLLIFSLWLLVGAAQFFGCRALPVAYQAFSKGYVKAITENYSTAKKNQQNPKPNAKQTTNYSIEALLIAYLFNYGWQLVVKLLCDVCSRWLCALAYHIGTTAR